MKDQIEDCVQKIRQCLLRPKQFFISWNGVLTLAFNGFPPQLETLKRELMSISDAIPVENPGSKWPKTTLGALKDDVRLTPDQLTQLTEICKSSSGEFLNRTDKLRIDRLSLVMYQTRSLEKVISFTDFPLSLPLDSSPPTAAQIENVNKVLGQAQEEGYWFHASKDGNRESHYTSDALGVTLVHDLKSLNSNPELLKLVSKLQEEVEDKLPGLYTWFDPTSLHVTVRGIIN